MSGWFDIYWRLLGLPMSRLKGYWVDSISFSLAEIVLWSALLCTVLFVFRLAFVFKAFFLSSFVTTRKPSFLYTIFIFLLGPFLLFLLIGGQGALPFFPYPTGWRTPLAKETTPKKLREEKWKSWVENHQSLLDSASPLLFSLSHPALLEKCNSALNRSLDELGFHKGRNVTSIKKLRGIRRLAGLSYGGPAYHDPITGELGMATYSDLPSPDYWYYQAICHEAAHAKGYLREIDAEILAYYAMATEKDSAFQIAAAIQFLEKSGLAMGWPESWQTMRKKIAKERLEARKSQPLVSFLRSLIKSWNLENKPKKYGVREEGEKWNPHHPFYATVVTLIERRRSRTR